MSKILPADLCDGYATHKSIQLPWH